MRFRIRTLCDGCRESSIDTLSGTIREMLRVNWCQSGECFDRLTPFCVVDSAGGVELDGRVDKKITTTKTPKC